MRDAVNRVQPMPNAAAKRMRRYRQRRREGLPQRLERLLSKRWFPAMNQICHAVQFSARQVEGLTDRIAKYFVDDPA
jgi:hypothetical protein